MKGQDNLAEHNSSGSWFILEEESQAVPWRARVPTPRSRAGMEPTPRAWTEPWAQPTPGCQVPALQRWPELVPCALLSLAEMQPSAPPGSSPNSDSQDFPPGKQNTKSSRMLGVSFGVQFLYSVESFQIQLHPGLCKRSFQILFP